MTADTVLLFLLVGLGAIQVGLLMKEPPKRTRKTQPLVGPVNGSVIRQPQKIKPKAITEHDIVAREKPGHEYA
jgi:hypothetical protein